MSNAIFITNVLIIITSFSSLIIRRNILCRITAVALVAVGTMHVQAGQWGWAAWNLALAAVWLLWWNSNEPLRRAK